MSSIKVTVEHAGAHEPSGETFADDFSAGLTSALREAGLKRGSDFADKIIGYVQTSGVSTVYDVEVDGTEPSAAAKKTPAKRAPKAKSAAQIVSESPHVDKDAVEVVTTDEATEKGTTVGDAVTASELPSAV